MKLGILTYHSQLNYGGVLQAFALQTVLERMGYEVVILDRWMDKQNERLLGPFCSFSVRGWCGVLARGLLGGGQLGRIVRHWRTMGFVRHQLHLSSYHFHTWEDLGGTSLGVDCLVVGSDQVWQGEVGDPRVYLLEGAPEGLKAIAYAASFGMRKLPERFRENYRVGFRRFSDISVREAIGVQFVEEVGGIATQVVDPTLLLSPDVWKNLKGCSKAESKKRRLVVYLMAERVREVLPLLERFAKQMEACVDVFVDNEVWSVPHSLAEIFCRARRQWSPVRVHFSAGPLEFVEGFSQATWVLSDSFHALMFASVFGAQAAIFRPKSDFRKIMFARIEEFAASCVQGPLIEDSVALALERFARGETMAYRAEVIAQRRAASHAWLAHALENVLTGDRDAR